VNKKAFLAIIMALIIPVICYLVIKKITDNNVVMPPHYYADSVVNTVHRGKPVSDTIWHSLPPIQLTNQEGRQVGWDDVKGKILVIGFFFTHCPSICPTLTKNMKTLQNAINNAQRVGDKTPDFVQFLMLSVDPERDSVQRLKKWADRFQINAELYWLLTGNKKEIYDLAINDLKLATIDGEGVDTSFIHTDRFTLIDARRNVRGYYRGLDTASLAAMSRDIVMLSMEKDRTKKSFLAENSFILITAFISAVILVTALLFVLRKTRLQ